MPVRGSRARPRGSATAVSTWYKRDGTGGCAAAAAGAGAGGAPSAYADRVPFLYSTYSFERAGSMAMPAAVYDELSAVRSGSRAASMVDSRE